jgi:hypothetical protein
MKITDMPSINMRKDWHKMLSLDYQETLDAELVPILYQYLVDSGMIFLLGPRATRRAKQLADTGLLDLTISDEAAKTRQDFVENVEAVLNHFKAIKEG